MKKICTSIEQSKKLIELGLDVNTADMLYRWHDEQWYCVPKDVPYPYSLKDMIPCWSLAALLDVIPKHIGYNTLGIDIGEKDFSIWYDEFGCGVNTELPDIKMENSVDACYEMIIKLHEL